MDIKETKEAMIAVAALLRTIGELTADGFQFTDVIAFIDKMNTDQDFANKVSAGLDGAGKISAELGDLSLFEGFELIKLIPDLFKK